MKKLLFTSLLVWVGAICGFAQLDMCTPDQTYADSVFGVYPLPFDSLNNPNGGIADTVYLAKDFQFVFTAVVGDSLKFGTLAYPLDSIRIQSIDSLPNGFGYNCSPSFTFQKNTLGCAVIFGNTSNPADIGRYDLHIKAILYTGGLPIPVTFPNSSFYPGHYYLFVQPPSSVHNLLGSELKSMQNRPNPFIATTTFDIDANEAGEYQFIVFDVLGKVINTRTLSIRSGSNQVEFDGSELPVGLYFYTISNKYGQAAGKMIISR